MADITTINASDRVSDSRAVINTNFANLNAALGSGSVGPGTANELAYFNTTTSITSLAVATYPSLTEVSYVKGVTSAIQTQLDGKQATLTGLTASVTELNYTDGVTSAIQTQLDGKQAVLTGLTSSVAELNILDGATLDVTELNYVDGVTSAIQTQLNAKSPSTSPTFATSITGSYLTASEILITDGSKNIVSAAVATYPSLTELTYVKGVTSAIQTQINTKANSSGSLTQFVGNTAWRVFYSDGSGDIIELALGADGTFLKSNGAAAAPTFATPAGSGDVSKVGTPVNNQIGVWTGDGTIEGDADLTFDTTTNTLATVLITATTVTANLTGNVTGNVSGSAATVTTAAQPAITSLGTLTTLTVDDITINGNTISSAGASSLSITPTAGQAILLDGTISIDAGVVTGATSITSTTFVGALTGNASTASAVAVGGITGLGTNVATALAVNVGSAGAFVTFNGALGTPSSGTVTNLTGTASININGTVGATTPTTATFTTATINTSLLPDANDGAVLGASGTAFSDLFLASGAVINWNAGNATVTHSAGLLTSNVDIAVPDEAYGSAWNASLEVPTKNAVYDKIQATQGYVLSAGNSITTPTDATTYYCGVGPFAASSSQGIHRIYIPKAGTILAAYITFINSASAGSAETSSVYIRLNATSDTLISSSVVNNTAATVPFVVSNTGLSIAVVAGDFIEVKWIAPTWATNPGATLVVQSLIYIE